MKLTFDLLPVDPSPDALGAWLAAQFERIQNVVNSDRLDIRYSEPEKPRDGLVVYADGTEWNPGSGEGFYGRENGAWVKL